MQEILFENLTEKIEKELQPYRRLYGDCVHYLVTDLKNDHVLLSHGEKEVVASASLIKVPILLAGLHYFQGDLGRTINIREEDIVSFSTIGEMGCGTYSLEEYLVWMIITSDNVATNVVIDLIGMDKIHATIHKLGLVDTTLQRKMMDVESVKMGRNNFTTLHDMCVLMELLYHKQACSSSSVSERSIAILKRQRDTTMLKRYIADDIILAHKTGEWETTWHDVGILYTTTSDYFIGVSVNGVEDQSVACGIIGNIGKIIYEHVGK